MSERKALKLRFEPDDYLCTWQVPGRDGDLISLPGSLEVRPDRPPRGVLYGDVPLQWEHTANGESSAGFPQTVERPILRGTLANGGEAVVLDARLMYWFPGQGTLSGRQGRDDPRQGFVQSARKVFGKASTVDLLPKVQATTVISGLIAAPNDIQTPQVAMRQLRNDLAHGQRGYHAQDLHEVVSVLERVVRAHAAAGSGMPGRERYPRAGRARLNTAVGAAEPDSVTLMCVQTSGTGRVEIVGMFAQTY